MGTTRHGDDPADGEPSLLLAAPRTVEVTTAKTIGELEAKLVDLWSRVNAAGDSVGFFGPSTAAEVRDGLAQHLSRRSRLTLRPAGAGHAPASRLRVLGAEQSTAHPPRRVPEAADAPTRCDRPELGRLLVAGMHAAGRGHGIEIGWLLDGLRFDTPTGPQLRDEVEVAIRLDGRPLFPLPSAGA